eukprot:2909441-Amphidinium_carterae.1
MPSSSTSGMPKAVNQSNDGTLSSKQVIEEVPDVVRTAESATNSLVGSPKVRFEQALPLAKACEEEAMSGMSQERVQANRAKGSVFSEYDTQTSRTVKNEVQDAGEAPLGFEFARARAYETLMMMLKARYGHLFTSSILILPMPMHPFLLLH